MKRYRVWTKNAFGRSPSVQTDWKTYGECKKYIIDRWGHWPPFAFISQAQTGGAFVRYNGD